jgi:hypothetical protein
MANNAQTNWSAMRIIYSSGDANETMINREWICQIHSNQLMGKHTKHQIKLKMWEQHKVSCYEYKNATWLKETNAQYVTSRCWLYFF